MANPRSPAFPVDRGHASVGNAGATPGLRMTRLNHAVLYVRDVDTAVGFYEGVLEFRTAERYGDKAAFLRASSSENHHDLGLFGLGPAAPRPPAHATGLYHLAWEVATIEDLAAAHDRLLAAGALRGMTDHGVSKSLYGEDPDGNAFEVMWQVPVEEWGDSATRPLDLPGELARWGGRG
jgi:catechol-2,3-dioxygenase